MKRMILAGIAGIVAMMVTVVLVEAVGHSVFPPPAGTNLQDPEALKALMASMPLGALVMVVVGWLLGAAFGSMLAARLARPRGMGPALAVGVVMLLASGATMLMIPHPLWMMLFGLAAPLPIAWLSGLWLGRPG